MEQSVKKGNLLDRGRTEEETDFRFKKWNCQIEEEQIRFETKSLKKKVRDKEKTFPNTSPNTPHTLKTTFYMLFTPFLSNPDGQTAAITHRLFIIK